jgi:hypothetical protein
MICGLKTGEIIRKFQNKIKIILLLKNPAQYLVFVILHGFEPGQTEPKTEVLPLTMKQK